MNSERMEEVEIIVARHIKNPLYREKFCRDGYAKILLQRLDDCACSSGLHCESAKYAQEYITYIDKYCHGIKRDMSYYINSPSEYYFAFNSVGIPLTTELGNLVHDYRIIFEKCYDDAKFRSLNKIEEEIAYTINDEDQKGDFILNIEAKTLFNLIIEYRGMKKDIGEAIDQYVAFIRDTYGIQVNIDRRTLKPLKIKRNTDVNVTLIKSRTNTTKKAAPMIFNKTLGKFVSDNYNSSEANHILPDHSEPHFYDYSIPDVQLNDLFDWVTQQLQNETNQEAQQAYSKVLDAIVVISDKDRFSRLSIDDKIAVMHFLEDDKS